MRFGLIASVCAALAANAVGCANEGETQVIPPVVLGMTGTAPPTYDDGQEQIYETYLPVPLPMRRAGDNEVGGGDADPYPRAPFHLASQTRITARYTISNLDNKPNTIELLINPWNEFVRYEPGVIMNDEETLPNLSGIDKFFVLPARSRVEGVITPDDMVELATDLATAMRLFRRPPAADGQFAGPGLFNRAFNEQNRSSQPDPLLGPFIPRVVAGLVGFDLGLRTSQRAKVAIEVVLDVEDVDGDRVLPANDAARRVGRPGDALTPPAAPMR